MTTDLIEAGLSAQHTGDLATARRNYARALEADPQNAEALHLLGLVEAAERNYDAAAGMIERAVLQEPQEPLFRMNLASVYEARGEIERAARELAEALRFAPNDAQGLAKLGALEIRLKNYRSALSRFERVCALFPDDAAAAARFGRAALQAGDGTKAIVAANRINALQPRAPEAFRLACGGANLLRDWDQLERTAREWTRQVPEDPSAWRFLSEALFELGRRAEAKAAFEPVLRLDPEAASNDIVYGRLCHAADDLDSARRHLERAVAASPGSADAAAALSNFNLRVGDLETAERLARQAVSADPEFGPAYVALADVMEGRLSDAELAAMERILAAGTLPLQHQARLLFAIGAVHDARGDAAKAFEAFTEANARVIASSSNDYRPQEQTASTDRRMALFSKATHPGPFDPAPAVPVFIVGMPRSGTTLVESMLAAHPDVCGAGELMGLVAVRDQVDEWAKTQGAASIGEAPVERLREWRALYFSFYPATGGARVVVDKQPANHAVVGLIPILFPEARIVHIRRDPVATSFSIYRRYFQTPWLYANRLEDLGHYYGEYVRLMTHWETLLGGEYLSIRYEDLVRDPKRVGRSIFEHCGLAWRDDILEFHKKTRNVATFSAVQVRRPVYQDAAKAPAIYEPFLEPLRQALTRAGVELEAGR